jgi:hypothetical protein
LDIAEGELKQVKDRKDAIHIFRGSRIRFRCLLISAFGGRCSGVTAWLERSSAASISLSSWMEAGRVPPGWPESLYRTFIYPSRIPQLFRHLGLIITFRKMKQNKNLFRGGSTRPTWINEVDRTIFHVENTLRPSTRPAGAVLAHLPSLGR